LPEGRVVVLWDIDNLSNGQLLLLLLLLLLYVLLYVLLRVYHVHSRLRNYLLSHWDLLLLLQLRCLKLWVLRARAHWGNISQLDLLRISNSWRLCRLLLL